MNTTSIFSKISAKIASLSTSFSQRSGVKKAAFGLAASALALVLVFGATTGQAFAATPTLSVTTTGNNTIQLTVYGDSNSSVALYYYPQGTYYYTSAQSVGVIGDTNSSGYFTATLSASTYAIAANSSVYVIVNGQQSTTATWPSVSSIVCNGSYVGSSCCNNTSVVYPYNSSCCNSGVYNGAYPYNTTGNCCNTGTGAYPYNTNGCTGIAGPIVFGQTSISLNVGQSTTINVTGGQNGTYNANAYYISSSPSYVSATINGGVLSLYGTSVGSGTVTVCGTATGVCGTLNVSVQYSNNGGGYNGGYPYYPQSAPLTFSQSSLYLYAGQSTSFTVYGGTGVYNVTNSSYQNTVSAAVVGNTVTVYGIGAGTSYVTVCDSQNDCGNVTVSVGSNYQYGNGGYYYPTTYTTTPSYTYPYAYTDPTTYAYPTTYTYPTTYSYPTTYTYPYTDYDNGVGGGFVKTSGY